MLKPKHLFLAYASPTTDLKLANRNGGFHFFPFQPRLENLANKINNKTVIYVRQTCTQKINIPFWLI